MGILDNTVICIPSYHRHECQKTVAYLSGTGVPKDKIYLFVQTEEDAAKYGAWKDKCQVVYKPANNLPQTRNNILEYCLRDNNVVMMDDDISCIAFGSKRNKFTQITSLDVFSKTILRMFEETQKRRGYMFGVYPVYNEYFMDDTVSTRVTVNTLIGFPRQFPFRFDNNYIAKEDIELCGRVLKNGGNIIRFNNVAYKADHRTNKGGACDIWKTDANAHFARTLCKTYPNIFAVQKNKPSEVRLVVKDVKQKGIIWER